MPRLLFVLACLLAATIPASAKQPVSLTATDGVTVSADLYPATRHMAPLILAFHQAGSNRAEYLPIAPKLNELGFAVLAIDQRSGGEMWGQRNETAAHLGHPASYLDALKDLEAALAWAKTGANATATGPILVMGSSYSASLVFLLAAGHPQDIAGILAFSPGEYLGGPTIVARAARRVTVPVFITSAQDLDEIAEAKKILSAVGGPVKIQFVPRLGGVHGASTLRSDSDPQGADEVWQAVDAFLARFRPHS